MYGNQIYFLGKYVVVQASQSMFELGNPGKQGDYLLSLLIMPMTDTPGNVLLFDNDVTVFAMPSGKLKDVAPIKVEFLCQSTLGPWKVTTGPNVKVLAVGDFDV